MRPLCRSCYRVFSEEPDVNGYDQMQNRLLLSEHTHRYRHHDNAEELLHCVQQVKCPICVLFAAKLDEIDLRYMAKPFWLGRPAAWLCAFLIPGWVWNRDKVYHCGLSKSRDEYQAIDFVLGFRLRKVIRFYLAPSGRLHDDPGPRADSCAANAHDSDVGDLGIRNADNLPKGQQVQAISESTSLEDCWSQFSGWCFDCVETHGNHCGNMGNEQSTFCPTRVIDVGLTEEDGNFLEPHLCVDSTVRPRLPYMTLSHCWGKEGLSCKLLPSNLDNMKDCVPYDSLPKTFQDAIAVTRKFKVRYLWIDALCILQGESPEAREDWIKECRLMGQVYLYSWCNIAASGASDSSQGLFFKRNIDLVEQIQVRVRWPWWEGDADNTFLEDDYEDACLGLSPLLRRAWALQELVLARRVLHFGSRQIAWKCRNRFACETFPQGVRIHPDISRGARYLLPRPIGDADEAENRRFFLTRWQELLEKYMDCELTNETDKLVAISGLANVFERCFGENYVAGLWRHTLPLALTWRSKDGMQANGDPARRQKKYRAPTWSWASVDGRIEQPCVERDNGIVETLVDVLDIQASVQRNVDEDVYTPLAEQFIMLSGTLVDASKHFRFVPPIREDHKGLRNASFRRNRGLRNASFRRNRGLLNCYFDEDLGKSFFPYLQGLNTRGHLPRSLRDSIGRLHESRPLFQKLITRFRVGLLKQLHQRPPFYRLVTPSFPPADGARLALLFICVVCVLYSICIGLVVNKSFRIIALCLCYATSAAVFITILSIFTYSARANLYFLPIHKAVDGTVRGLILTKSNNNEESGIFYRQGMFTTAESGAGINEELPQPEVRRRVITIY